MIKLAERICLLGLVASVAVLTLTALPVLWGSHLMGNTLLVHMMASGVLVFVLPALAVLWLMRTFCIGEAVGSASQLENIGFWATVVTGLLAIVTVFVCMLPVASTESMHLLVSIHAYAGFAMVPAVLLFIFGAIRLRRTKSMRSTTPG
ncbi:hypothetical protein CA13_03770 [Planctomycetes bacterium CA13]|uniref:Cytochrome b561 domain-containing protein n=1 Tax=Novipirellula herctigrandis TaxID=2527986 RepID=A0A5C5YVW2_9BACT|nr:hypothetical protein CA13_03770 [Planctomycetes bacterium CA13]